MSNISPELLSAIANYRKTGVFPRVAMGDDGSIPTAKIFWMHKDDRASRPRTPKANNIVDIGIQAADSGPGRFDLSTPDGLADFRAFLAATLITVASAGGMYVPTPDGPVPAVQTSVSADGTTQQTIVELTPLVPSQTLPPEDQLHYIDAVTTLFVSILQYGKRFAVLTGDPNWDAPPPRSSAYCPAYTMNGDPKVYNESPFPATPTPTITAQPDANPDCSFGICEGGAQSPSMKGTNDDVRMGEIGIGGAIVIVGLVVAVCWAIDKLSDKVERSSDFGTVIDALQHNMTNDTNGVNKMLDDHIAADTAAGKVTPLSPAEQAKIDILKTSQANYYAVTKQMAAASLPPPPAPSVTEEAGGVLKTALVIGGAVLVGKVLLDTFLANRKSSQPAPSQMPILVEHEKVA